ncbi:MAG: hypothetical protein K2Q45_03900 [Nitrosomonas sp.]|nr:hypothetical protein [Nitrosomonas sp.]
MSADFNICRFCGVEAAGLRCGHRGCVTGHYCSDECADKDYKHHMRLDCVGALNNAFTTESLSQLQLGSLLGEGAFGAVFQTTDSMYAVKIQANSMDCMREASIQYDLALIPNVFVAKVYFYSDRITSIPMQWRVPIQRASQDKGSKWAAQNWSGRFCIIVMDLLKSTKQARVAAEDMPAYAFGLLFTVQTGYAKQGFQHLDIHGGNVNVIPNNTGEVRVTAECQWRFTGVRNTVRLLDFGISVNRKYQKTVTYNSSISPPETLLQVAQQMPFVPYPEFDYYSIGILLLNNVLISMFAPTKVPLTILNMPITGSDQLLRTSGNPNLLSIVINICCLNYALGNGAYPTGLSFRQGTLEYYLFSEPANQAQLNAIAQANVSDRTRVLNQTAALYGAPLVYLIKQLVGWNPSSRKIDLVRHPYFAPFVVSCPTSGVTVVNQGKTVLGTQTAQTRNIRLDKNVQTLYYKTNSPLPLRLGSSIGGGIFFALNPQDADRKKPGPGKMYKVNVRLGMVFALKRADPTMNGQALFQRSNGGADSVYWERSTGPEYVIYNLDQIASVTPL